MNQEELAWDIIKFIDRNGKIVDRGSNPYNSWLHMKYKIGNTEGEFKVQQSPYSNGSAILEVKDSDKLVFKIIGNLGSALYNSKTEVFEHGDWENAFK